MPRPSRLVHLAIPFVPLLVVCASGGRPHASMRPAQQPDRPQSAPAPPASAGEAPRQTQEDDYTSYELLAPESASFRILYDVTATTPGARYYFNTIRKAARLATSA